MMTQKRIIFALTILNALHGNAVDNGSSETSIVQKFENIIKSPHDHRSYRGLKLANELKVVLISDPTTDVSAVSLSLGVGGLNDFPELPGMANFLAHLVLKGSEKNPGFEEFLKTHNGTLSDLSLSSWLGGYEQDFSFTIGSDSLKLALEKFANLFTSPRLSEITEAMMEETLDKLEMDFENSSKNIHRRSLLAERRLCKKNHPFSRLHAGNRETLYLEPIRKLKNDPNFKIPRRHRQRAAYSKLFKEEVLPKLLQFHSLWYSSNLMNLAVLGREDLDKLQEIVVSLFKNIENKKAEKLMFQFKQHPFGRKQLKHEIYIVPNEEMNALRLMFPIPFQTAGVKTAPRHYVTYLIEARGPSTLSTVLSEKDLCQELTIGFHDAAGMKLYAIVCYPTDHGLTRIYDIVTIIFQYIRLIEVDGVNKSIFDEIQKLSENNFLHDISEESPLNHVKSVSSSVQRYAMEEILSHMCTKDCWDSSLIRTFLAFLNPENMIISIISRLFVEYADQKEMWFQTPYKIRRIPEKFIVEWKNVQTTTELRLPQPNEFMPESFQLYPLEDESKEPYIIHDSSISRFWFKQDDEFKLAKLHISIEIICPVTRLDSSRHLLLNIFTGILDDFMKEKYAQSARAAGLKWTIDANFQDSRVFIYFYGFNDKMPRILEKFVSTLLNMDREVDMKTFTSIKKMFANYWAIFDSLEHSYQVDWYLRYLLDQHVWGPRDIISAAEVLQFDDWRKFLREMFSRVFVHALILGNCSKQMAIEIANIIERPFKTSRALLPEEILLARPLLVDEGAHITYLTNNEPNVYVYCVYYQFDPDSHRSNVIHVISVLFDLIVHDACLKLIAEEDNLSSHCEIRSGNGSSGLFFLLTSKNYLYHSYMDSRVENFLHIIHGTLKNMTQQDFEKHKKKLLKRFLEAPSLEKLGDFYWKEISERSYNFEGHEVYKEQLLFLGKADLMAFFKEMLYVSSPKRRKLAMYLFPEEKISSVRNRTRNETTKITDYITFKSASSFLPLSEPYIEVNPLATRS